MVRTWSRVGDLRVGGERRLAPVSDNHGWDRGRPIDRYYIEHFLAQYGNEGALDRAGEIRGRVLEFGDAGYARRFGRWGHRGSQVQAVDVFDLDAANPHATIVGDLAEGAGIRPETFDCVICTQTLMYVYDIRAGLQTLHRILRPGGVVLATFPGLEQLSVESRQYGDYWRFTSFSARRLFADAFPEGEVTVATYGNVFTSAAGLYGFSVEDLSQAELDLHDEKYEVIIAVRASKAGGPRKAP